MNEQTKKFATAFREWQRRYNEDPFAFSKDWPTDSDYGDAAAKYFQTLLDATTGTQAPAK